MKDNNIFNYDAWIKRFPELSCQVSESFALALVAEARCFLDMTDNSVVCDPEIRRALLGLLIAHLAILNERQQQGMAVGQVKSVNQGSVSITMMPIEESGTAAWFAQTHYGNAFWQATLPFRSGFFIPTQDDYRTRLWP